MMGECEDVWLWPGPPLPQRSERETKMRRRIAKALRSIACGTPDAIAQARAELVSALEL